MIYIKDMDMPIDCLGCRIILCDRESYLGMGRPKDCPMTEVVRCKDCHYRELDGEITHFYWCRINERSVDDDDYCAWGEESEVEE